MAKNEEAVNDYRAERKARIAKAAKQKNKAQADPTKAARLVIYIIGIIAAVAIIVAGLFYFGVPQRFMTAVKVGNRSYSYSEYSYYYSTVYQSIVSSAEEQQSTLGFSLYQTDVSPAEQTYTDTTTNEAGEEEKREISYAEYIDEQVISTIEQSNYYLGLAKEKGMELSEENKAALEETIGQIEQYAGQYSYSASRYVSLLYGKGMTMNKFKKLLEEQYLVSQYLNEVQNDIGTEITDDEINKAYKNAKNDYNVADIRLFGLAIPGTEEDTTEASDTKAEKKTKEDVEKLIKTFKNRITDEKSFIKLAQEYCEEADKETFKNDSATLVKNLKYSIVSSNISKDLADWLFSADRKEGDTNTITTDNYVYVIYVINPAYKNEDCLVDARHILVSYDSVKAELDAAATDTTAADEKIKDETGKADDGTEIKNAGTGYSLPVVLGAYNKAHDILEEYGKNATEENFAALAEQYSTDTGSVGENAIPGGGLYTSIEKGKMVKEFEDWIYNAKREPGDTAIVRTEYGYHIMYFVQKHEEPSWKESVRSAIASEKAEEFQTTTETEYKGTAVKAAFANYAYDKALELVVNAYVNNN